MAYPTQDEIVAYIAQSAKARGIDPATALKVARSEGLSASPKEGWQSYVVRNGVREPSYGIFQLHKEGLGARAPFDITNPANWKQGIDFALDNAKTGGWGPWYGAKQVGVTGMAGIGGAPSRVAQAAQSAPVLPVSAPPEPQVPKGAIAHLEGLLHGNIDPNGPLEPAVNFFHRFGSPPNTLPQPVSPMGSPDQNPPQQAPQSILSRLAEATRQGDESLVNMPGFGPSRGRMGQNPPLPNALPQPGQGQGLLELLKHLFGGGI